MKKTAICLFCLLLFSVSLFADMSKTELQKMYMMFLRSEGIDSKVDSDGDIEFEYEGEHFNAMTFYIMVHADDQQFFQIMKFYGYSLENTKEKRQGPIAASVATRESYIAKIYINNAGDNILVSAETYLASPEDFKTVFFKMLSGMEQAMKIFLENME